MRRALGALVLYAWAIMHRRVYGRGVRIGWVAWVSLLEIIGGHNDLACIDPSGIIAAVGFRAVGIFRVGR